jgi:hypothetical protein
VCCGSHRRLRLRFLRHGCGSVGHREVHLFGIYRADIRIMYWSRCRCLFKPWSRQIWQYFILSPPLGASPLRGPRTSGALCYLIPTSSLLLLVVLLVILILVLFFNKLRCDSRRNVVAEIKKSVTVVEERSLAGATRRSSRSFRRSTCASTRATTRKTTPRSTLGRRRSTTKSTTKSTTSRPQSEPKKKKST